MTLTFPGSLSCSWAGRRDQIAAAHGAWFRLSTASPPAFLRGAPAFPLPGTVSSHCKTHIRVRIPLALCLEWPQCVPIVLDTHSVSSDSGNKGFPGAAPCC